MSFSELHGQWLADRGFHYNKNCVLPKSHLRVRCGLVEFARRTGDFGVIVRPHMQARTLHQSVILATLLATLVVHALISASCGGGGTNAVPVAVTPTTMDLSAVSLSFGSQPVATSGSPASITLTDTGNSTLSIASLALTGTDASSFVQTNTCGASVAAGGKCTIAILYTPAANGTHKASLTITDSALDSPQSVTLTGKGLHDIILTWSPSTTPGIAGYNVFRSMSSRQSATPVNSSPISGTTYADTDVQANQKYSYWVTAVGSEGITESPDSPGASATVPSP